MISNINTNLITSSTLANKNTAGNRMTMINGFKVPSLPQQWATKGLSEEDIKEKVDEIIQREMAAGRNPQLAYEEFQKLELEYMSPVSPDRHGIIKGTIENLTVKLKSMMDTRLEHSLNFFQVLFNNSIAFKNRDIGTNFMNFRDAEGNTIAGYMEHDGWRLYPTAAETERSTEFTKMVNKAIFAAEQLPGQIEYNTGNAIAAVAAGHNIDLAKLQEAGTPLDMQKLAAHGITLDPETGQTLIDKDKLSKNVQTFDVKA